MRVTEIHLRNFKRFTDLVIRDIPDTAKLVVVVGPNGSGKSSLFDAFLAWYHLKVGAGIHHDESYYRKRKDEAFALGSNVAVTLAGGKQPKKGCLYVRTAYRNDADFSVSTITRPAAPAEQVRFSRLIDNDTTVSDNYQRLLYDTIAGVYKTENDSKSVSQLRDELIGDVQASMTAVFSDLHLDSIADPLGGGSFFFTKGAAEGYHYKNLSGGEKAAFDLLLDLHVKVRYYPDAIYCIDEMETHLHTRVQGALLKEMVKILPGDGQLWVTTHSLGMLRAAQAMSKDTPGSIAVLDFDGIDPDVSRELTPSNVDRLSWEKMLSVALDDLSQRIAPEVIVVCEGSAVGAARKNFDAVIYDRILGSLTPGVVFISGGASNQVKTAGVSVQQALTDILPPTTVIALCDRDDKSPADVSEFERSGNLVLPRRNLESYLLADELIRALAEANGHPGMVERALAVKASAVAASVVRGNPEDDLKSAAGDIYTGLKTLLSLRSPGANKDSFMRDTMAPLITPKTEVFRELKAAIVDRLPSPTAR